MIKWRRANPLLGFSRLFGDCALKIARARRPCGQKTLFTRACAHNGGIGGLYRFYFHSLCPARSALFDYRRLEAQHCFSNFGRSSRHTE